MSQYVLVYVFQSTVIELLMAYHSTVNALPLHVERGELSHPHWMLTLS